MLLHTCAVPPLQSSLDWPLTSARTCGAVYFYSFQKGGQKTRHGPLYSLNSNKPYVFRRMPLCPSLSLILCPQDLYIAFLHLFPSLLPPFVTLLLFPDLLFQTGGEKTGGSEGRVMNQRELVGSNSGCVFVQDLVVL